MVPAAALVAAACMLWGARALVPTIAASIVIQLALAGPDAGPAHILLLASAFKALYWAAARVLTARRFDHDFATPSDVSARFAGVFVVAAGIAALIDSLDIFGLGGLASADAGVRLRGFWIGDLVAVIALSPAMVVSAIWYARTERQSPRQLVGALRPPWSALVVLQLLSIPFTLLVAAALAASVGFFSYTLCFLPLGWIALTRGARVAALANAALTVGAVALVHARGATAPNVLEIQTFVGMLAVSGLLVGSVADERERAVARLRESENRYRRLVELLPDPLLVHVDGEVVFANGAAATVLGAPDAQALIGMPIARLATPRSREAIDSRLRALGEGRGVPLIHHTLRRLDGSGSVEVESVSIPFSYEERPAALTVARDVTARVRLEEELRHAQRMEAVGRLAGGVAHDFNNLLTVIISYSELMASRADQDDELAHDIGEVRHAADRAARAHAAAPLVQPPAGAPVRRARAQRGREGGRGMFSRLLGRRSRSSRGSTRDAGSVFADQGQLEQVIMNLVVNARDAMPDGGVLTVETGRVAAADAPRPPVRRARRSRTPRSRCSDTGARHGRRHDAPDLRSLLHHEGDGARHRPRPRHGARHRAAVGRRRHGGEPQGDRQRVLHPAPLARAARAERAPTAPTAGPRTPRATATPRRAAPATKRRVLLVDDEASVREGVRRILAGAGYDVVEAEDGAVARDILRDAGDGIDLLLSDVAMPVLDGRQLARDTRAARPRLPILLMSGFTDPDELGRAVPGVALLHKPLDAAALLHAVRSALA